MRASSDGGYDWSSRQPSFDGFIPGKLEVVLTIALRPMTCYDQGLIFASISSLLIPFAPCFRTDNVSRPRRLVISWAVHFRLAWKHANLDGRHRTRTEAQCAGIRRLNLTPAALSLRYIGLTALLSA